MIRGLFDLQPVKGRIHGRPKHGVKQQKNKTVGLYDTIG